MTFVEYFQTDRRRLRTLLIASAMTLAIAPAAWAQNGLHGVDDNPLGAPGAGPTGGFGPSAAARAVAARQEAAARAVAAQKRKIAQSGQKGNAPATAHPEEIPVTTQAGPQGSGQGDEQGGRNAAAGHGAGAAHGQSQARIPVGAVDTAPVPKGPAKHYKTGIETMASTAISISADTTVTVTVGKKVSSVFVANPSLVTVRPISAHRLILFGRAIGHTTVTAVNQSGTPISKFSVRVTPSRYRADQIDSVLPHGAKIDTLPGAVRLHGEVNTPLEANEAYNSAKTVSGQPVINDLRVRQDQQVVLMVRVAQMSRSITQQLGINWQSATVPTLARVINPAGAAGQAAAAAIGSAFQVSVGGKPIGALALKPNGYIAGDTAGNLISSGAPGNYTLKFPHSNLDGVLSALDQDNLAHILAEPTLVALSGHTASFVSGGSFPVPVPEANGQTSVEFQNYGVQLEFKPTVLSNGQIYLNVAPTVSQVSNLSSVSIAAGNSSLVVPSLIQQQARTTVMLGSGQTLAIAGLLENQSTQTDESVPGLGDIPILGGAFRNDNFTRSQDELVILVTPYIVKPVDSSTQMHLPGGNDWTPPNMVQRYLLGWQDGKPKMAKLPHNVGFILK